MYNPCLNTVVSCLFSLGYAYNKIIIYFRGQSGNSGNVAFRRWYNNIQELRSLLPSQTPFIALTATAMKTTREKICSALNMNKPEFVMVSPERPNITYGVLKMSNKIHVTEYFDWLLQMIKSKGNQSERCIMYCQTVNQCSTLYSLFSVCLGSSMYLNEEKHNPRERIVEMMHAKTPETVKETVLNSMASYDGHVRVLICTIAFGMGVDAKGVRTIIHFGPSRNLESYVQESGRCSRDGQPGSCVVLYLGRMLSSCAKDIRSYVSSGTCRREQINSYFDHPVNVPNTSQPTGHNCCDSCAALCTCDNGTCTYHPVWAAPVESTPETRSPVREVSDDQLSTLKKGLLLYKKKWIAYCMEKNYSPSNNQVSAISCPSFLLEFGNFHIAQVIENANVIASFNDILKVIEIWRLSHAVEIWKLMRNIFTDLADERLPEISLEDTDINEDKCDDDWVQLFNDSITEDSMAALLEGESMDIDEDVQLVDYNFPAAVYNVLNNV